MSKEEQNSKSKIKTTISNETFSKKDVAPIKMSQSMNTESYEYYNQKTTSKNNITESPYNTLNQQSNSRYSSNNQNSNSKNFSQSRVMKGNMQFSQDQINSSGLICTCNQSNEMNQNNNLKCTCSRPNRNICTCDDFQTEFFGEKIMENKSKKANYGYQLNKQKKMASSSTYSSNNNNMNQNIHNSKTYQVNRGPGMTGGQKISSKIVSNSKIITYVSPNNPRLQISEEKNNNINESSRRFETNVCTCSNDMEGRNLNDKIIYNYSYYNSNEGNIHYSENDRYKYSNIYSTKSNKSYSVDNRSKQRGFRNNTNIEWNAKCVGQNNESLQILAEEKPKLVAQSVQDMQVIQEPKPVQILLPIQPNEIDYTLGLEIYGKNSEEEKRALKEAERLRKLMEIHPENIESLNIKKAYNTIVPHFAELNIDRKEELFCQRQIIKSNIIQ